MADAGRDQTVKQTWVRGAEVRVSGSGSYDPDGDQLSYKWYWRQPGDSITGNGEIKTITLLPGTTTLTLEVYDGDLHDEDTVEITVVATDPEDWTH